MTSFKITDKMADAVLNAQPTQTLAGERLKITSDVHDRVCAGLQNRGLVEYVKVTENMSRMVLSADGVKVLRLLKNHYHMRSFDLDCGEEMISILAGETQPEPAAEPVQEQTIPVISTQSALNGKIYRSDGSVSPAPLAHGGRANVREVSKVLKAAGFSPRNGERIMARSGYQASQDGPCVRVSWRAGVDTDLMGDGPLDELRTAMNNAYATVLEAAGYPVSERRYGDPAYVTGTKRKS